MIRLRKCSGCRALARFLLLVPVAAGLDGCSAAKFGYNHAERLLSWKIDDYVDLEREQKTQLHQALAPLLAWHRASQLPRYADWLDRIALAVEAGEVSAEQVESWFESGDEFGVTIYEKAVPVFERLLPTLSEAQVRQIGEELERKLDKARKDQFRDDGDDPLVYRQRALKNNFKDWFGPLRDAQAARLESWARDTPRVDPQWWFVWRRNWNRGFIVLLTSRQAPDFRARREAFEAAHDTDTDPRLGPALADNRREYSVLISEMLGTLDATQTRHLLRKLRGYAEDCRDLVAQT